MADIFHFSSRAELDAAENLSLFIQECRDGLTVFGRDLDWGADFWAPAGVAFGNIDQKTRILRDGSVLRQPFLEFAKAYFRYQQGHKPTKTMNEMRALKTLERALIERTGEACVSEVDHSTFDLAANLARGAYSAGMAYHAGRELERLARFLVDRRLISRQLQWVSPIRRPVDTVRTGKKARAERERKLPSDEAMDALAEIFSGEPKCHRDIFTTSTAALLVSAPSRITEVLALGVDCEIEERKIDGTLAYGWRFLPGKGAPPMIKWIPDAMVSVAKEAMRRIRSITEDGRWLARWLEDRPTEFPRHKMCPDVAEAAPLTNAEAACAIGIYSEDDSYCASELCRLGLSSAKGASTLRLLNVWVRSKLPKDFPWYDRNRGIRYSDALYCMMPRQLDTVRRTTPVALWKPTANIINNDLCSRDVGQEQPAPSIFDRHRYNDGLRSRLKITSHQFRHLLNTMAQRGGLSQAEIARWSGRVDVKQNRDYDHMSEFELVDMLRSHDPSLRLDQPLRELVDEIAKKLPISREEFELLVIPTAHVTEYGYCVHDYVMSPCQRYRDCLNCSEQVCIKGDHRISRLKQRLELIRQLKARAEVEIAEGAAGADRWYELQKLTESRLRELVAIMEDPSVPDGTIIRLRNDAEFSPLRRALSIKLLDVPQATSEPASSLLKQLVGAH